MHREKIKFLTTDGHEMLSSASVSFIIVPLNNFHVGRQTNDLGVP